MRNSKTAVVFLHGFGENSGVWTEFISKLPAEYHYFCPDFSIKSDCKSINDYAEWLMQVLDNQKISQFFLIGHSMGGYIALAFAEKYPEKILGLGLFNSTSYADSEERKKMRLKTIDFIDKHGSATFIKDFYPNMFSDDFKARNQDFIQHQMEEYSELPKEALMAATLAMRNREDKRLILEKSNFPTLIIAGEKDKFVSLESIIEQIKITKNPHFLILPNTAHAGMFEETEPCIEAISKFIQNA